MDIVLLLGAGTEPAQSIARRVVGMGARVYGFANKFPDQGFSHRDFVHVGVNPADPSAILSEVEKIIAREGAVTGVILAGHAPIDDNFESAHPNDVALTVFAGLAGPLAAVRAAMPGLIRRRGFVLALTRPATGPGAALAGLVEAGLASFCDGLFAETRDTGLRVCHIRLQENGGRPDPSSRYNTAPQSRIQPEIVADTIEAVIRLRENNAITRLVLRPQATREEPRIPVTAEPKLASLQMVQLPTWKNYPPAEEKIYTPEYRRPDYAPPPEPRDNEFDEDDDESVDPELAYLIKPRHRDRFVRDNAAPEPRAVAKDEPVTEPAAAAPVAAAPEAAAESPAPAAEPTRADALPPAAPTRAEGESRPQREFSEQGAPRDNRDTRQPGPRDQRGPRDMYPPHKDPNQRHRQDEGKQYYDPYAPQPPRRKEPRGPRPGAMRINAPGFAQEQQQEPRQQQRPDRPLRFEQMPRPRDWQGPKYPQGGFKGNVQPTRENTPAPREERREDRREPRIAIDAEGRPLGGVPEAKPNPAPTPRPVPVIVPFESKQDSVETKNTGRSEAVTLDFSPKKPAETPAAAPTPAAPEETPAPVVKKPVREKIVKAERDEELDEAPIRVKKRPVTKKTAAKTDKALAKVEEAIPDEPELADDEPAPVKKPRKTAAKKKAE